MRYYPKRPYYSIAIHLDTEHDLEKLYLVDEDAAAVLIFHMLMIFRPSF